MNIFFGNHALSDRSDLPNQNDASLDIQDLNASRQETEQASDNWQLTVASSKMLTSTVNGTTSPGAILTFGAPVLQSNINASPVLGQTSLTLDGRNVPQTLLTANNGGNVKADWLSTDSAHQIHLTIPQEDNLGYGLYQGTLNWQVSRSLN